MTIKSKTFSANTYKERIQIFRYYFLEEIEQWFTSSIACCAKCAENFWRTWPGVRGDKEIEMDLEDFFEGSCLSDIFYPKEIEHFSKYLQCPKCHETLDSYFVIFEHPFTPPNSFDRHLNEIALNNGSTVKSEWMDTSRSSHSTQTMTTVQVPV